MSIIAPEKQDLTLLEAIELESQLHDALEGLTHSVSPMGVLLQITLTEVQDRIAHLTSLLTF